jgi:hypothetical protein
MSDDFDEEARPLHSARRRRLMRIVALISMGLLVIPGLIGTLAQADHSARYACAIAGSALAPQASSIDARFSLFPLEIAGWQCYAEYFDGTEVLIATLGPIPGIPNIRAVSST